MKIAQLLQEVVSVVLQIFLQTLVSQNGTMGFYQGWKEEDYRSYQEWEEEDWLLEEAEEGNEITEKDIRPSMDN